MKVIVTQKFKDLETNEIIEPGTEFECDEARAKRLVEQRNFAKYCDNTNVEDSNDDATADEDSDDNVADDKDSNDDATDIEDIKSKTYFSRKRKSK